MDDQIIHKTLDLKGHLITFIGFICRTWSQTLPVPVLRDTLVKTVLWT